jgi:two-component system, NtrC family, nitrogen regulation response regulator GlnG
VRSTGNAATLWRWVSQGEGDLVITDVVMPDENAFDLLPRIKKHAARSADHRDERAEHVHDGDPASERGAYEYLPKAVRPEGTDRDRRPRWRSRRKRVANHAETESKSDSMPLVGRSPAMQEIYRVARAADADRPHRDDHPANPAPARNWSRARCTITASGATGPFVAVNMAAIPRDLDRKRTVRP